MNANLLDAIKKSAAVPSMPQVVTRFLEIMQDPSFDYNDLVKVLSSDPGTVSEVLRLVNSALFGVRQKIVSLRQALTLLGPKRTRSLLLGRYLVDTMSSKATEGLDMSYFWRRSLASSVVASRIADKLFPQVRDEVFIGALLADIGVPIIAEAMPTQYFPIASQFTPRGDMVTPEAEIEAVGATHSQVSAMVLKHWTLPDAVCTSVNLHQSANPGDGSSAALARTLNASDRIAKMICEVADPEVVLQNCTEAMAFVGANVSVLVDLLPTIEGDIEELAEVLRIDVVPSNIYSLIAKAVQENLTAATTAK